MSSPTNVLLYFMNIQKETKHYFVQNLLRLLKKPKLWLDMECSSAQGLGSSHFLGYGIFHFKGYFFRFENKLLGLLLACNVGF